MDNKEQQIMKHYKMLIETKTFDEYDILGFLIFIRRHLSDDKHPNIKEFIDIANSRFKINITTNGYLINRIKNVVGIRQINISLHSYDDKYNIPLDEYMNNIFDIIDSDAFKNTYISFFL